MKRGCVLAVVLFSVALSSHANLLTNGSFEFGNFVPNAQGSMILDVGATDMTGWSVQTAGISWIGPGNPFGLTASDGGYFLDLSGYHDNAPYGGVLQSQTIATVIGAEYRLSFDLGTDPQYDSSPVSILVTAGTASDTFTSTPLNPSQWEEFLFDFIATSDTTSISLNGEATTDQKYLGLDNVTLIQVPEPSTLSLLAGPGLLVLAAWRRFRKV